MLHGYDTSKVQTVTDWLMPKSVTELQAFLGLMIDTDVSGAMLSQVQDGHERTVAYFSTTFISPVERNCCVTRQELLTVVWSLVQFRPYLYGWEF